MSRRGNNEGSIYKRNDGRWVGQIQTGFKIDGTRKFTTYYGKTRQEVADKIANSISDITKNLFVEPSKMTVEDWFWNWIKCYKKDTLRPNSYARYLYTMNSHIVPELRKNKT